jgi:hypothetical protein
VLHEAYKQTRFSEFETDQLAVLQGETRNPVKGDFVITRGKLRFVVGYLANYRFAVFLWRIRRRKRSSSRSESDNPERESKL